MKFKSLVFCLLFIQALSQPPDTPRYFDFHNNFWMNLHHTLYREAALQWRPARPTGSIVRLPMSTSGFTDEEKQAWEKAVQFYVTTFAHRRLLFDPELVDINNALGVNEAAGELRDSPDIPGPLAEVLRNAAPVYRKNWWPVDQKTNQEWIDRMRPKVNEMAPFVVPRLEQLLQQKWPGVPDLVDVTAAVSEVGAAYTTKDPGHSTISSTNVDSNSPDGIETVFHEGSHLLTSRLEDALTKECTAQKKDCADLWHAIQFYTVGAVVKAELAKRGTPNYRPYAYKFGLYDRGQWPKFRAALEKDWQPYIDGKMDFPSTLKKVVADLP